MVTILSVNANALAIYKLVKSYTCSAYIILPEDIDLAKVLHVYIKKLKNK